MGLPVPGTSIKVVDPSTGDQLPDGERGLVKVKGPQVMKGYYKVSGPSMKGMPLSWHYGKTSAHFSSSDSSSPLH